MNAERAFRGAVSEFQDDYRATHPVTDSVTGMVDIFGGGSQGVSNLSMALAGTRDKKSLEYKAARRNIERYRKRELDEEGQKRTPKYLLADLRRVTEARVDKRALDAMAAEGLAVHFDGRIRISEDEREREFHIFIDGDLLKPVAEELEQRHYRAAFDEFSASMMTAWGMAPAAVITDINELELRA